MVGRSRIAIVSQHCMLLDKFLASQFSFFDFSGLLGFILQDSQHRGDEVLIFQHGIRHHP